jgi:hypothetical protein
MQKLRVIVLVVSIMPLILNFIVYFLLKSKKFVKVFFGDETINETMWLPWLLVAVGWFLTSLLISLVFDL